jgi:hypothetical protein
MKLQIKQTIMYSCLFLLSLPISIIFNENSHFNLTFFVLQAKSENQYQSYHLKNTLGYLDSNQPLFQAYTNRANKTTLNLCSPQNSFLSFILLELLLKVSLIAGCGIRLVGYKSPAIALIQKIPNNRHAIAIIFVLLIISISIDSKAILSPKSPHCILSEGTQKILNIYL